MLQNGYGRLWSLSFSSWLSSSFDDAEPWLELLLVLLWIRCRRRRRCLSGSLLSDSAVSPGVDVDEEDIVVKFCIHVGNDMGSKKSDLPFDGGFVLSSSSSTRLLWSCCSSSGGSETSAAGAGVVRSVVLVFAAAANCNFNNCCSA